jgi:hypothetical protein
LISGENQPRDRFGVLALQRPVRKQPPEVRN